MSIERVVVPVDGSRRSETAVPAGVALATRLGAGLDLFVARPASDSDRARAYLDGVDVPGAGPLVRRQVQADQAPVDAIVEHANNPAELVCLATHGHTGVGEAIFGSTAEAVLHAATRPVVVVGPHARPPAEWSANPTILVCVDGSETSERCLAIAELASWLRASVRLVTVVIVSDGIEHDPVVERSRIEQMERLTDEFEQRGVGASYEILPGHDIWPPINHAAESVPAALLAVVSQARTGAARVLLGSEAITVVRHSPVPVVAVHPA